MLSKIRKHLTPSTGIALIALVFALTSGAFAATGGSPGNPASNSSPRTSGGVLAVIAKAKAKSKTGARGPAGPAGKPGPTGTAGATGPVGATGPAGPQGPQGAAGTNGQNGAPGSPGANGESVTSKAVAINTAKCGGLGGVEYTLTGKTTLICNGQTGFTETLPEGKTETGAWAATGAGTAVGISFPIPLSAPLEASHTHIVTVNTVPAQCPGTVAEPKAEPGNLCVYESTDTELGNLIQVTNPAAPTASGTATSGAVLISSYASEYVHGTFAVTAAG